MGSNLLKLKRLGGYQKDFFIRNRHVNIDIAGPVKIPDVAEMIALIDGEKFYLSGGAADKDIKAVKVGLASAKIIADDFGPIDKDSRALAAAKDAGKVILIARVEETARSEIVQSIETAAFYGIEVCGAVVVE